MKLHAATIDADCFAVRLLLGILDVPYTTVAVDVYPGDGPPVPMLEDGPVRITGLWPVLEHLAAAYRPALAAAPHPVCLDLVLRLRMQSLTGAIPADLTAARRALLALEDDLTLLRLRGQRFLAGPGPTIADLALYPAVALCRDVGLEHDEFPALRHWLRDVRALAPAVHMPGVLDPI